MSKIGKILLGITFFSLIIFLLLNLLSYEKTYIPLLVALPCLIGAFGVDFQIYKEFLFLKTTRNGLNMGTVIILCLILMVAINHIAIKNNKTWDLTQENLFTLADQTVEILSQLEEPLLFKAFFVKGNQNHDQQQMMYRDVLRKYGQESNKVEESYINPHLEPALAREYNIDEAGGVIVEYKGQKTRVNAPTEEEVTNAIIKVTRVEQKNLYFFKNHEEVDLDADEERGGSSFKNELESASYNIKTLDALSTQGRIPEDADVLFILGPQRLFLDFEVQMVANYLKDGGNLLLALEPGVEHNFHGILSRLGVKFRGDYVIDKMSALLREVPLTALGTTYSTTNSITEQFPSAMTLFFMSSGWDNIETTKSEDPLTREDIVKTSPITVATETLAREAEVSANGPFTLVKSVKGSLPETNENDNETDTAEGDLDTDDTKLNETNKSEENTKKAENDNDTDAETPEEEESKEFHAVLYGDSDIFTNSRLFQQLNRDLVLNTVAVLAADEDLVSIRPKSANQTTFKGMSNTAYRVLVISVIILPLIFFIFAFILFYRRRNA